MITFIYISYNPLQIICTLLFYLMALSEVDSTGVIIGPTLQIKKQAVNCYVDSLTDVAFYCMDNLFEIIISCLYDKKQAEDYSYHYCS